MDIDIELEKLIKKYNVDTLGRQIYFEDAISEVVEKYSKFNNIALRGAGVFTETFLKFFNDKIKIKAIFDKNPNNVSDKILSYGIPVLDISQLDKDKWNVVIISTVKYKKEIKEELKNYNIEHIVDLYEEVEELYGMKFDAVFDLSNYNDYLYIIGSSLLYRKSKDDIEKEKLLKNIISSFLYNKDIFAINKCIDEYIDKKYTDWEGYKNFRAELNELMCNIKRIISNRNHKDVIILWQDNLMYNWVESMPFEKSCRDKGLFLENARGVTVWTRAAMKAVLDKRLDIDNYYFEDSDKGHLLTKFYIENGYKCRYIGSDGEVDLHKNKAVENQKNKRVYSPISKVYWNLLRCLVLNKEPIMVIAHSILESHWPNCTPNLESFSQLESNYYNLFINNKNRENKILNAVNYIDRETEYLISFLNDKSIKIIMSDHGQMINKNSRKWDYDAMHINFMVFGGDIKPKKCTKLFSIINFFELSKYILFPNNENFNNIFLKEVPYQACSIYNKSVIEVHIRADFEEWGIAYRGLESLEDRYILMETEKEIYNRLPDEKTNYIDDERFKDRINYLRKKTGNKFIDINKEPTFEYSHLLYDSLRTKGRI